MAFVWMSVISLGVKSPGHVETIFNFLNNHQTVFQRHNNTIAHPHEPLLRSQFLHTLFPFSSPNGREAISHYGFDVHFSDGYSC